MDHINRGSRASVLQAVATGMGRGMAQIGEADQSLAVCQQQVNGGYLLIWQ